MIDLWILRLLSLPHYLGHSFESLSLHRPSLSRLRAFQHIDVLVMVDVDISKLPFNMVRFGIIGSLLKVILIFNTQRDFSSDSVYISMALRHLELLLILNLFYFKSQ